MDTGFPACWRKYLIRRLLENRWGADWIGVKPDRSAALTYSFRRRCGNEEMSLIFLLQEC